MNEVPDHGALERFYAEGRSWGEDLLASNERSKRLAWWVATGALIVVVLQTIAITAMVPLKTVVPYTVLVDRQTGHVTTVDPTKSVEIAPDSALTRSMLAQYVTAREEVDPATIQASYRRTVLWSQGSARASYLAAMAPDSPRNPLQQLSPGTVVRAEVRSVTNLESGLAMVRFDRITEGQTGTLTRAPYVATIRFAYRSRRLSEADRFVNPLGFEVSTYRRDAESVISPPQAEALPAGRVPNANAPALQETPQ